MQHNYALFASTYPRTNHMWHPQPWDSVIRRAQIPIARFVERRLQTPSYYSLASSLIARMRRQQRERPEAVRARRAQEVRSVFLQ